MAEGKKPVLYRSPKGALAESSKNPLKPFWENPNICDFRASHGSRCPKEGKLQHHLKRPCHRSLGLKEFRGFGEIDPKHRALKPHKLTFGSLIQGLTWPPGCSLPSARPLPIRLRP